MNKNQRTADNCTFYWGFSVTSPRGKTGTSIITSKDNKFPLASALMKMKEKFGPKWKATYIRHSEMTEAEYLLFEKEKLDE
jgi:hypothetical protein